MPDEPKPHPHHPRASRGLKCGATMPDDFRDEAGVIINRVVTIRCGLSAFHGSGRHRTLGQYHKVKLPCGLVLKWPGVGSMRGEWDENTPTYNANGNLWYGNRE